MACKVILLCPISIFFILIGNGSLFLKFTVYIVKIDKNRNPLKSIAENDSSLPRCIWIVQHLSWSVEGGTRYRNTLYRHILSYICKLHILSYICTLHILSYLYITHSISKWYISCIYVHITPECWTESNICMIRGE